jgi:Zn-dependent protease
MNIGFIAIYLVFIVAASVVHEFMHGVTAYWLGDDTASRAGRLSFNPLRHIDPWLSIGLPFLIVLLNVFTGAAMPIFGGAKPVPFNPNKVKWGEWGAALVAIAGPLTNLIFAFILTGILFAVGGGFWGSVLEIGVMVNMGFFAFNILPIPPLDGSRVIYAIAPEFIRRFMEAIERYGLILVFIIIIFFSSQIGWVISNVINFFLNLFISIFG